jgi:hypothetical protein
MLMVKARPLRQLITRLYPSAEQFEQGFENQQVVHVEELTRRLMFYLQRFENKCSRQGLDAFLELFQYNEQGQT